MMHKERIQYCFDRAADSYDDYSLLQQGVGRKLVDVLPEISGNVIDLGCGTGLITQYLLHAIANASFQAIDISERALIHAKKRLPAIDVHQQDFDMMSALHRYQLVFSNMSLQWSPDFKKTLKVIHRSLSDNGVLAFTLPLQGTFCELPALSRNRFYSVEEVSAMLHEQDFNFVYSEAETTVLQFDSFSEALRSIKQAGANYLFKKSDAFPLRKLLKQSDATLTYVIGTFVVKKHVR